tara:strand:+ start:3875 stop:4279 length:405 start_codon:yes stop_codon:yes gene_type:complete
MDNRRLEIMLGQSVNLANAACLQSKAYEQAATLESKKEIIDIAIEFYFNIIKDANDKHLPENKMTDTSYGKNYNPNYSKPKGVITEKQIKMIHAIIKFNQSIPLDKVEFIQNKITTNTLDRTDIDEFAKSYGRQ